jgi:hypothetical protein
MNIGDVSLLQVFVGGCDFGALISHDFRKISLVEVASVPHLLHSLSNVSTALLLNEHKCVHRLLTISLFAMRRAPTGALLPSHYVACTASILGSVNCCL